MLKSIVTLYEEDKSVKRWLPCRPYVGEYAAEIFSTQARTVQKFQLCNLQPRAKNLPRPLPYKLRPIPKGAPRSDRQTSGMPADNLPIALSVYMSARTS